MEGASRRAWIEERRNGVGGSDAPTIIFAALGRKWYTSPLELWLDKTGQLETPDEDEPNRFLYWGSRHESTIVSEYAIQTERYVLANVQDPLFRKEPYAALYQPDGDVIDVSAFPRAVELLQPMVHPNGWMRGNVDGWVLVQNYDPLKFIIERGLEAKTASAHKRGSWGAEQTDDIPDEYLIQVGHYQHVASTLRMGEPTPWDVACLFGGNDYGIWHIPYDAEFGRRLEKIEAEFWRRVVERDPPDPTGANDEILAQMHPYKEDGTRTVEYGSTMWEEAMRLRDLLDLQAEANAEVEKVKARIKWMMRGASEVIGPGFQISWRRNVKGSRVFRPTFTREED